MKIGMDSKLTDWQTDEVTNDNPRKNACAMIPGSLGLRRALPGLGGAVRQAMRNRIARPAPAPVRGRAGASVRSSDPGQDGAGLASPCRL
jgi:hypothetical protein